MAIAVEVMLEVHTLAMAAVTAATEEHTLLAVPAVPDLAGAVLVAMLVMAVVVATPYFAVGFAVITQIQLALKVRRVLAAVQGAVLLALLISGAAVAVAVQDFLVRDQAVILHLPVAAAVMVVLVALTARVLLQQPAAELMVVAVAQ